MVDSQFVSWYENVICITTSFWLVQRKLSNIFNGMDLFTTRYILSYLSCLLRTSFQEVWKMALYVNYCVCLCSWCLRARRGRSHARDGDDEVVWATHQHHQPTRMLHTERSALWTHIWSFISPHNSSSTMKNNNERSRNNNTSTHVDTSLTREKRLSHTIYTSHDLHILDVIAMTLREVEFSSPEPW